MSSVGYVEAVPYTTYHQETRATNVWVPPVTLATSVSINTPPYQPGYTIPGTPAAYYAGDTTGSVIGLESVGSNDAGQLIGGAVSGPAVDNNRPVIYETVDRWGNVLSTSDQRSANWMTHYTYNQNNQLISVVQPTADGTGEGAVSSMYYDADGRQVATRDANGNVNGQTYDALGDVTAEIHADGGVVRYAYNALGEKTSKTDAMGNTTLYGYDGVGRLIMTEQASNVQVWQYYGQGNATQMVGNGPLYERIAYDQRGNKISTTDAANQITRYTYDLRGNVVSTQDPDGNVTLDAYDAENHKVAEVDANHYAQTWRYDYFGQVLSHADIGGAQYSYTYDNARQLIQQTNTRGVNQTLNYDVAGHVTQITDNALGQVTQYAYDASGNRIREVTMQNGAVYQDNHLAYDALDRLRKVEDGNVSIVYDYDANGNRTHIHTQYEDVGTNNATQDQYFAYDSMNRETVADAVNPWGSITQSQGHQMTYDLNGNRISDTSIGAVMVNGQKAIGTVVQNYTYDSLNRLVMTKYNGTVIDQRQYDADGRVVLSGLGSGVSQSFYDTLGLSDQVQFNEYDAAGRLLFQRNYNANWQEQDNVSYTSYDAVGNVLQYQVNSVQGTAYTNTYTNALVRYAGYEVATQSGTSTLLQPGQTNYQYDVDGNLIGVTDSTDAANNRSFVNDVNGQILQKTQGSAVERELIANGNVIGTTGRGTDPNGTSSGPNPTFVDLTNFDPTYRPINANYPSATPGAYTIHAGDTLQSIAQGAYGDSKLWYLIADANGLSSDNDLRVGQTLNIPNRVTDVHNASGDFKPYDSNSVVGSTAPNLPNPPAASDDGCGAMLGIIILVIVVIVTVIFQQYYAVPQEVGAEAGAGAGAAAGMDAGVDSGIAAGTGVGSGAAGAGANTFGFSLAGTTAAGTGSGFGAGIAGANTFGFTMAGTSTLGTLATAAATGAAVDAATQLVGDALGTHHGFDLLETVEAAGTSMILPGAGEAATTEMEKIGEQALRGALVNAATQGVRLAMHQQEAFNWGELALSAAAAPVAAQAGEYVRDGLGHFNLPSTFDKIVSGMASSATTRLATGGKIDLASVAADAFGNELGDGVRTEVQSVGQQLQTLAETQQSTAQPDGFDVNAAYAQLVDAFSASGDPAASASTMLLAANNLTQQGQPVVATDAGGGGGGAAPANVDVSGVEWGHSQIGTLPDGTVVYAHTAQPNDPTLMVEGTGLSQAPSIPGYTYAGSAGTQIFYSPDDPNATLDQQRAARIAAMQAEAAVPANVQDGGLNIVVTGLPQDPVPAPVETSTGTIRALSDWEGFLAFNPVGHFATGLGRGVSGLVTGLVNTVEQGVLAAGDAISYGLSRADNALGGDLRYQPESALGISIQNQGAGETALNVLGTVATGTAKSILGPINALYRHDATMLGESVVSTVATAAPILRADGLAVEVTPKVTTEFTGGLPSTERTVHSPSVALERIGGDATESDVAGLYRRTENVGEFSDLKVPMQMRYVEQAAQDGGVGLQGVRVRIVRDSDLVGKDLYGYTHPDGSIDLYPDAFTDTEQLVKTLGHERTHTMQIDLYGHPNTYGDLMMQELMQNENAAHGIEDSFWQYYLKNNSGKLEGFR